MPSIQDLSDILAALYEAPLDTSHWQDFLRLVAAAAGGEAAALLVHDFEKSQSSMSAEYGFHPEVAQLYTAHYGSVDVWRSAVTASHDWLGLSQHFVPPATLRRTEFYNDLLLPYEITHGMFAMVERSPARVANLSVCRSATAGPFHEKDLAILKFLKPHIKRAYRLHSELTVARATNNDLLAILDTISNGVILLDNHTNVMVMNSVAEQLFATKNGLSISERRVKAEHSGESARLEVLIGRAVSTSQGQGLGSGGSINVSRRDLPALQILVCPIRGSSKFPTEHIGAVIFISDPLRYRRPAEETLRMLFGLSRAECRVALMLSDGRSPTEVANTVGTTLNTVRTQIKSIFSKTNVKRQGELVRLLLRLPGTTEGNAFAQQLGHKA